MQHHALRLRPTEEADLELLFQFQMDEQAGYLAAFTAQDPTDWEAYFKKYTQILRDPTTNTQTILLDGVVVGSIAKFEMEGEAGITYWLDRRYWGQGIASTALHAFLHLETMRPIFGRIAFDNVGSQRVLEKAGFVKIGTDSGFANARQAVIEEFIYQLA
jgi:ribosomal-protein-alanine N-acetyltransferase